MARDGTVSLLLTMAVPLVFMVAANAGVIAVSDAFIDNDGGEIAWTKLMTVGPSILLVGFTLVFWAARGFVALGYLASYPVAPRPR